MKQQTFRVVLEVGVPAFIGYLPNTTRKTPELKELITLDSYRVTGGILQWSITLRDNRIYQGGLLSKVDIGNNIIITPAIPMLLHKRWNGLSPEFIILADESLSIEPLSDIKKKYLNKSDNLFQAITGG